MNKKFQKEVETLAPKLKRLVSMAPVSAATIPKDAPERGVYLFSEKGRNGLRHLYVGRTNRFRQRMGQHSSPWSQHNQAAFAFRLAREQTRLKGERLALTENRIFKRAFLVAKARVRHMELRIVEEVDPFRQALLEMYASVALDTPHNDFETH